MSFHAPQLDWIDTQTAQMRHWVTDWSKINSGTGNLEGLEKMAAALRREAAVLGGELKEVPLAPYEAIDGHGQAVKVVVGKAITITKRSNAPLRVLLCIHMDTVYPPEHPFQSTTMLDANTLQGPGVADAKGGLVVMLKSLEAFERSPHASRLGWEVLINPDEEIGSPGSRSLLEEAARRNHLGLLFEPALGGGDLVSQRKGTGNFTMVVHGRAAHAGRDFASGRSAVVAMAELVGQLHALNAALPGVTVNVGRIEGGGPVNVVPDLAICRINVRTTIPQDEARFDEQLSRLTAGVNARDGISARLHGGFTSPPKLLDDRTQALLASVVDCGRELGLTLQCRPSGGTCDGNRLAAAGLPNVDSLGVRGGSIHSPQEFVLLDSLPERAKLTALLLMKLAAGEIPWPRGA